MHRDFSFSGLKLTSSAHNEGAVAEPVAPQSGSWPGAAGLLVERVAFLGLPKAKSYSAKLPGGEVGNVGFLFSFKLVFKINDILLLAN